MSTRATSEFGDTGRGSQVSARRWRTSPGLAGAFGMLYGTFWSKGALDHRTKEVTRMRNARVTDCGY